jgi:hypothetical protein
LRRTISTPHSSRFARLASGAFYCAVHLMTFYDSINFDASILSNRSIIMPYSLRTHGSTVQIFGEP